MSNPGEDSDGERSSSPTLFEDSQNQSIEVLNKSRNDSKETNVSTEVHQTSNITDDSPSQDFLAPRPRHDLFSSQQSYMSTSSPLRYPQQSPLSLSRSGVKCPQTRLELIEEDSPNVSLTPMDDAGSFGSLSGMSDHTTPNDSKVSGKRKAIDLSCSDSEVEVLCEKNKDESQEEPVKKKPRESVEFLRYASTPHRAARAPSFQASDISDEAIQLKPIAEEIDTGDDLGRLHFSPSQDVEIPEPVNVVKKLNLISQEESPDTGSTSTDSNTIFGQVNKIAERVFTDSSSGTPDDPSTLKAKTSDGSSDTCPIDGSEDPVAVGSSQKQSSSNKKEADDKHGIEGYILTKIMYDVSDDSKSMENVRVCWQLPVAMEIVHDTSSSVRTLKSLSPSGQLSDSQLQAPEPVYKTALRYSMSSSSSSSSGGSMLPPLLPRMPKIPPDAFKALHKTMILKKDARFCADGVLDIIPPQMEIKPPIPVPDNDNKAEPSVVTKKEENIEDANSTAKKSLSSKAKTNPRSRRKAGSSQKTSAKKNGTSSNNTTPVAKSAGVFRTGNRRRKLNGTSSGQGSPEPLPGDDVEPASVANPPAEESTVNTQQVENELDPSIIRTGQPVFAKWTDELYYSGKVGQEQKGKWDIHFDDGARRQVFEENIMFVDKLPLGQPVFARYQTNSQNFYPGIIYSYTEGPAELLYQVDLDNEGQHDVPRSQLCMSQDQVNILRGDTTHNQSITTPTHRHDVSLDNMLDGKRSRSKKLYMGSPSVSHTSGRTRSATSGLESKPGCSRSLSQRSNSVDLLEASSDSQADAHVLWKSEWDNIPGAEEAAYYPPPVPNEDSLPKNKSKNSMGPIPQKKIFKDLVFCLSFSTGQGSESQSESQDADSDRDDGLDFNWRHLEQQLSKGGGEVVNFFEEHHLKRGSDRCFMITNRSSTSTKSIMCLALGVRSVRFMWIIQSCMEGKLLSYKSYLLPAGQSLYPVARIEWSSRPDKARPFNNMTIALITNVEQSNFLEFWKKVLLLGKASRVLTFVREDFITQEKNDLKGLVDIIVTDNDHTEQLVDMANELRLPLVRTNWAIQCLIKGESEDTVMFLLNNLENTNLSEITRRFSASQEV